MSNLSNNNINSLGFSRHNKDGLELLINELTGEVRMSQAAIQRLTNAPKSSLSAFLRGNGSEFGVLELEMPTVQGSRMVQTYDEKCFVACVKKFNIDMIDLIIEAGTRLYLYGLAGYGVKLEKPSTSTPPTQPALNPVEALIAKYPQLPPKGGVLTMAKWYNGIDSVPKFFIPRGIESSEGGLNSEHCEWLAYWDNQEAAIAFKRLITHECVDFDQPSYNRMSQKNVVAYNVFDSLLYKMDKAIRYDPKQVTPKQLMHYLDKCDLVAKNPDAVKDYKSKKFDPCKWLESA